MNTESGSHDHDTASHGSPLRRPLVSRYPAHTEARITSAAWSPDGSFLALGTDAHSVRVWNASQGRIVQTLRCSEPGAAASPGHYPVYRLCWSPDGSTLAAAGDRIIRIWEVDEWRLSRQLEFRGFGNAFYVNPGPIYGLSWSSDLPILAAGYDDGVIRLWDPRANRRLHPLSGHRGPVYAVACSPDGGTLASCSEDETVRLWNLRTHQPSGEFHSHGKSVLSLAWSPDGDLLASGGEDGSISIWDAEGKCEKQKLTRSTRPVTDISFSCDGRLVAVRSDLIRIFGCESEKWELVGVLNEPEGPTPWYCGLTFHPTEYVLITYGTEPRAVRRWMLDAERFAPLSPMIPYRNAKVVILGDSGGGKSALADALAGNDFQETFPTQGRRVLSLDKPRITNVDGHKEIQEILLWDFSGHRDFDLVHQLHMAQVSIAILVIDSEGLDDALRGTSPLDLGRWQAQLKSCAAERSVPRFLVAGRSDRNRYPLTRDAVATLLNSLGCERFFATSAKEGRHVPELGQAIRSRVDWESVPCSSSSKLFMWTRKYVTAECERGRLLATVDDLRRGLAKDIPSSLSRSPTFSEQFQDCLHQLDSMGLAKILSFGNLVLLKPELLDIYATAMIRAAAADPDGLGCISEQDGANGSQSLLVSPRMEDPNQERWLLIAAIEDLVRHDIAYRADSNQGTRLVFPSQVTQEKPAELAGWTPGDTLHLAGPLQKIYSTLVAKLHYSDFFKTLSMWANGGAV